jgi:tRNA pseudouridine55 synthase
VEVERKPRRVEIFNIQILEAALPRVTMEVTCSRGTYIRTLCEDIGETLGCGGCMEQLTRTRVAQFTIRESHTLAEIEEMVHNGQGSALVLPIDQVFSQCPRAVATEVFQRALENGNRIPIDALAEWQEDWKEKDLRLYDSAHRFVGIYRYQREAGDLKPVKMFYDFQELS